MSKPWVSPVCSHILKGDPKDGVVVLLTLGQASMSLWLEDHRDVFTEEFHRWYQSAAMMLYRVAIAEPLYSFPQPDIHTARNLFHDGCPHTKVRFAGNYYRKEHLGDFGHIGHLFIVRGIRGAKAILWDKKGPHTLLAVIPVRDEYEMFDRIFLPFAAPK
jgi:hypothetical protein